MQLKLSVTNDATPTSYNRMLEDIDLSLFKTHKVATHSHKNQGNKKMWQSKAALVKCRPDSLKMKLVNLLGVHEKKSMQL